DGGEHEEGQEGEVDALALLEGTLRLRAQAGDLGDVDLDDRGELGLRVQGLDHALGDDLAQAARLLRGPAQGRDREDRRGCRARGGRGGATGGGRRDRGRGRREDVLL